MPVFRVTSPDGAAYDVTAPDGASEQDAMAVAQAHHNVLASFAANSQSNPAAGNMPPSPIDHRLLSVFPNGSTVIIPQGYDAKPGPKLRGWGQPRNPQ